MSVGAGQSALEPRALFSIPQPNTGAVLVQRAIRLPHVECEVQKEERINVELIMRLCELLLGSTVLSGHDFFFSSVLTRREKEREREDRTYRWRKFRFQWLSQRSEEGQERLEVQVKGGWSGKAHRSVPTSFERSDRVFPVIFCSWAAARAAPNGVKEGTTFRLVFVA